MGLKGKDNPNWRGGRTRTEHGYILIRVGMDHHLADCRGYAYEHRIVAESKIGRRLEPGEIVHHTNGDKTDNRPENLDVLGSIADHRTEHRSTESNLMLPDEENPLITCGCGCGAMFRRFDSQGRPRGYQSGHNPQPSPTMTAVLSAVESGAETRSKISEITGIPVAGVGTALWKLKKRGLVTQIKRGAWKANIGHQKSNTGAVFP